MDYAGHTVPVVDRDTGEVRDAQIFVGVLGASNFTFVEATWSQSLPVWIGSHIQMFEYLGAPHNEEGSSRRGAKRDAAAGRSVSAG